MADFLNDRPDDIAAALLAGNPTAAELKQALVAALRAAAKTPHAVVRDGIANLATLRGKP